MATNWRPDEKWLADFYARTGKTAKEQPAPQAIQPQAAIIRQATKDRRNKLEKQFDKEVLYWQEYRHEIDRYKPHGIRFQLCNGLTYTPDYYVVAGDVRICYDTKGEKRKGRIKVRDKGASSIKIAAKEFPEFKFVLTWKDDDGEWKYQEVKEVES